MRIPLADTLVTFPLPATERWPDGVFDRTVFAHGTMSVIVFAPRGADHQTSHDQDELYVIVEGRGTLVVEDERIPFGKTDVLFVPSRKRHRFEDFSDDLVTWAIFWGPAGGEVAS